MRKSATLLLVAAAAVASVSYADAAPLRASRAMLASLAPEVAQQAVEVGAELPEMESLLGNGPIEGLYTPVSQSAIFNLKAANSAQAARRALAPNLQIIGYCNVANSPLAASTFYYLPVQAENVGSDFKTIAKFTSNRVLDAGGVYDVENYTFTGPSATISTMSLPFGDMTSVSLRGFYKINVLTGRYTVQNDNLYSGYEGLVAKAMAGDPTQDGIGYGYYGYKDDVDWLPLFYTWNRVDYNAALTANSSTIKDAIKVIKNNLSDDEILPFVAADTEGQYYGISTSGELRKIEKSTGAQTAVGQTAVDVTIGHGATGFNPRNNTILVYTINGDNSGAKLYEVDPATAETTVVATYDKPYDIANLQVMPALAADKAPDAPTMVLTTDGASMDIEYSINLPSTLYDGTPIQGDVDWEVTANGEVVLEGKNAAGANVAGTLTLANPGVTEFVCVAKNAEGDSPKAKQTLYVGPGEPNVPKYVRTYYNDGKANIYWKLNTGKIAADAGYVDPTQLEFEITDAEGNVLTTITDGSTSYSFDYPYTDEPTSTEFGLTVIYKGHRSAVTTSTKLWTGVHQLPYTPQLQGTPSPDTIGFVVEDTNDNDGTWYLTESSSGCAINVYSAQDDWLFLPDMKFEAGKVYTLDFDINGSNNKMVVADIYAGHGQHSSAMTVEVMEPTGLAPASYGNLTHYRKIFSVPETGIYNLGFHVSSSSSMGNWISIDELTVSDGFDPQAPASPFINSVVPDKTGENTFSVNITAPYFNMNGDELDEDEMFTAEVLVDGEVVNTYTDKIKTGGSYELKGTVAARGNHEIGVRCSKDDAVGPTTVKTAYVGPYAMEAPTNATIFLGSPEGNVTVTWNPATLDVNGTTIPSKYVTYMVYGITADGRLGEPMLKAPVSSTHATFKAVEEGQQKFVQYVVGALNHGLEPTQFAVSNTRAVGTPMETPVQITNPNSLETYLGASQPYAPAGLESYLYTVDDYGKVTYNYDFGFANNSSFAGVTASDDNAYMAAYNKYRNLGNDFFTGLINLKDAKKPQVLLDLFKLADTDANVVQVIVDCDDQQEVLFSTDKADMSALAWKTVCVDLSDYIGRYVQVRVRLITMTHVYSFFDNLRVIDRRDNDVAVLNITAPSVSKLGDKYQVNALIENQGLQAATDFDVELYRDGELLETRAVGTLDPLDVMSIIFDDHSIEYFDNDNTGATYQVKVNFAADENSANDASEEAFVLRRVYRLPTVADLAAEATEDGEGVKLTWTTYEHDPSQIMEWTEDFEGDEVYHGDNEYLDWTMVDVDDNLIGGISVNVGGQNVNLEIPNHDPFGDVSSFFIWDWEDPSVPAGGWFAAHSGRNMLVNMYTVNDQATALAEVDDWAISPLLSGNAQTISFWARPFEVHYAEELEIYYTTEDSTDPADFILLGEKINLPVNNNMLSNFGEWLEYTADLPEGALHFAVRCLSSDGFMCCLDDFTFESAGGPMWDLIGYDVYRNGVKINKNIVYRGEYVDQDCPVGDHTYHVVGIYAAGNSELSNPASVSRSGLNSLIATKANVKVENHDIVVDGTVERVAISTVDGKVIYTGYGDARVNVLPAIYLVTVGNTTVKVAVK